MRTTVNLEPSVHAGLRALSEREGKTLGEVIERLFCEHFRENTSRAKLSGFPTLPFKEGVIVTPEDVEAALEESDEDDVSVGRKRSRRAA